MAGRKSTTSRVPVPDAATAAKTAKKPQSEGLRETVEAVAIAFVLAFLFKTFQAELYVIPTGSMAPTLYGRHKEVICSGCHFPYTVGASQEVDQESGILLRRLEYSECPNCRHQNNILDAPVFNGDRILVNKPVGEYRRFDVVVFKNPEEPHVNYIKRLVGLPGETIRIRQGDLYVRNSTDESWRILRKDDPDKQRDIQLVVYDDRYPPRELIDDGAPERWTPSALKTAAADQDSERGQEESVVPWIPAENAWKAERDARTYRLESSDATVHWLRYRHLQTAADWTSDPPQLMVRSAFDPSLIVDTCGFNTPMESFNRSFNDGRYWVGDLTINAKVELTKVAQDSRLIFELSEGSHDYRCEINPETGLAECLLIDRSGSVPERKLSAQSDMIGPGTYTVSFANVDDRLCLWVNDEFVPFGDQASFERTEPNEPTEFDLAPVGIAGRNLSATVSELVLQRDIYYRNDTIDFRPEYGMTSIPIRDTDVVEEVPGNEVYSLTSLFRDPRKYARRYRELTNRQWERFGDIGNYVLAEDEFLMFGDNSPSSKDSRLFDYYARPIQGRGGHRYAVQRQDLIGEAVAIFWPHGIPFLNDGLGFSVRNHRENRGNGQFVRGTYPQYRFPFYPNISRMKKIR